MKYLTGKDYPDLCDRCQAAVNGAALIVAIGADTDDEEAPLNFVYDNGLYCGGYSCTNKEFTPRE